MQTLFLTPVLPANIVPIIKVVIPKADMPTTLTCPHCGKPVEITSAFKAEAESSIRAEISKSMRSELDEKEKKIQELQKQEISLRDQQRKLEEKDKDLELTIARRVDDQRKQSEAVVTQRITELFRLKEAEKDKVISDLKNSLEDAQRKAQQGSQQLQGEVQELELERELRNNFPTDDIAEVKKGSLGADITQTVKTNRGNVCGVILWESKRTKNWSPEWITKLKDDLRQAKANIPIIVTSVLPKEAEKGMGLVDGVWVTNFTLAIPLAELLRNQLRDVAYQKFASENRGTKAEALYNYFTGHEFVQHIQSLAEVYRETQEQITKEKAAFERIWKARESQAQRLLSGTISIYGQVQGIAGQSLPPVPGLELPEAL